MDDPWGVYSFRFTEGSDLGLLDLFALGRQVIRDPAYRWHGLTRTDGPLFLFQYTWSGGGRFAQGGRTWTLGPGDGFLVSIPSDHEYWWEEGYEPWQLSFVLFRPAGAERLWAAISDRLGPVTRFPRDRGPIPLLETMISAAAAERIRDPVEASGHLYSFLLSLARQALAQQGLDPSGTAIPPAVLQAQRLLDEAWDRPWNLTEVARAVGLSPSHFHRTFRRYTQVTPLEWLSRRRMEKAVEFLGQPGITVEMVARRLGFGDTGHFIRVFRRWTGTTPGALKGGSSVWSGSKIVLSARQGSDGFDAVSELS